MTVFSYWKTSQKFSDKNHKIKFTADVNYLPTTCTLSTGSESDAQSSRAFLVGLETERCSTQLILQSVFCYGLSGQTCNKEKCFSLTADSGNAVSVPFCTWVITVSSIQNCWLFKVS